MAHLRQSSGVLYYEHPAGNIAVSYRAGNADVVSLAVDSLRWIHALFEKKGMLDDKNLIVSIFFPIENSGLFYGTMRLNI